MKNNKTIIGAFLLVVIIGGAYFAYNSLSKNYTPDLGVSKENTETQNNTAKTLAADFTVYDEKGNSVKLSDYFGKPIVLNFWASWCPPCKAEFPDFEKKFGEVGSEVQFLMINMTDGQKETVEKGAKYITDNSYTMPVFYDTSFEAASAYSVRSLPTTLFIDSEGYIVAGREGMISEEILSKGIEMIQK